MSHYPFRQQIAMNDAQFDALLYGVAKIKSCQIFDSILGREHRCSEMLIAHIDMHMCVCVCVLDFYVAR
jgi:hypothetical protein